MQNGWNVAGPTVLNSRVDVTSETYVSNKRLCTVATSANYSDLINVPTALSKFTNDLNGPSGIQWSVNGTNPFMQVSGSANQYLQMAAASTAGAFSTACGVGDSVIRALGNGFLYVQTGGGGPAFYVDTSNIVHFINVPVFPAGTIPAAQVSSDWNATTGVAVILNKPTIPAAQIQSDWTATSGTSAILHKPIFQTGIATMTSSLTTITFATAFANIPTVVLTCSSTGTAAGSSFTAWVYSVTTTNFQFYAQYSTTGGSLAANSGGKWYYIACSPTG